jgi:hypothetical protein
MRNCNSWPNAAIPAAVGRDGKTEVFVNIDEDSSEPTERGVCPATFFRQRISMGRRYNQTPAQGLQ